MAHSVFREDPQFLDYASGKFHLRVKDSGASLSYVLPENEEVFESFATRVRVLTLEKEDVYFKKVVRAVERVDIESRREMFNDLFRKRVAHLRERWNKAVTAKGDDMGYQVFMFDPNAATPQEVTATMQQLADSWMYADLAHTSVKKESAAGLEFDLMERYIAAVGYYSRIASLAVHTFQLIEFMNETGVLILDPASLDRQVELPRDSDGRLMQGYGGK